MNARFIYYGICMLALSSSCQNIGDADPAKRSTFVHFYEEAHDIYGVVAEPVADGYVIMGYEKFANENQNTIIIRTDAEGIQIGSRIVIPDGFGKALKVTENGYYILSDSIKRQESDDVPAFDITVSSTRIINLDINGNVITKLVLADKRNTSNITDIFGSSLYVKSPNEVIVLGTYNEAGLTSPEQPFLISINPTTLDTLWYKTYDALDRDYVNSKSMHMTTSGKLIWASALLKDNQNFERSYLSIPVATENSVFTNFDLYAENSDQQIYPKDIQPYTSPQFGFGVVGTFATPTGNNSNIFFMRTDESGNINTASIKYYDGELSANNQPVAQGTSASEDSGDAIISTSDGGFIVAGSMTTTVNRGNGGKDILLIKVDSQGNIIWNKIIGGEGDETVSSIRETTDGSLLICGTNDLSGLASIFLMKTDKNGELTK